MKGIFRSEEEWNRRSTLRFAFHRINPNNRAERTRGAAFKIENSATECLQTGGPRRSSPTFYEEIVPGDDEQLVETCYHRDFQLPPLPTVSLILYLVNFRLSLPTFSPPLFSPHENVRFSFCNDRAKFFRQIENKDDSIRVFRVTRLYRYRED